MRLTDLYPLPVPVVLAGETHYALPLRVRDLAGLEYVAASSLPDPFADLPEADTDTPEVRRAYRDALDRAELWGKGWGSDECTWAVTTSAAGQIAMLSAALRHEELTADRVATIAANITTDEWDRLYIVAFGIDPASVLVRQADSLLGITPMEGNTMTWPEVLAALCKELKKTPEEVGDMPITGVRAILNDGKIDPWKCGGTPDQETAWAAYVGEKRHAFWSEPLTDG